MTRQSSISSRNTTSKGGATGLSLGRPADSEVVGTSRATLSYYDRNASRFRAATWDHDVSQNIEAFLAAIGGVPPRRVLDLGCGPGRDLVAFARLGHDPIGLDGSASFVAMAKAAAGVDVWHQDFADLDLPPMFFDGIFANASLFHVPAAALAETLKRLCRALKPGGVLFASNPRGANEEGWNGARYGCYWDLETWTGYLAGAGFRLVDHYYRPAGLPRAQQPWLATISRKV